MLGQSQSSSTSATAAGSAASAPDTMLLKAADLEEGNDGQAVDASSTPPRPSLQHILPLRSKGASQRGSKRLPVATIFEEEVSPTVKFETARRRLFIHSGRTGLRESTRAERIESWVNSLALQLLLAGISVLYCAGLLATALDQSGDFDFTVADWIFVVGSVLVALHLTEFSILVTVQAGICRFWKFFTPLFHKLLSFVLLMLLITVTESTFVRMANEKETFIKILPILPADNGDRYRITTAAVLFYRLLRFWAIKYRISVAATLRAKKRRLAEDAHGVWADDHRRHMEEHRRQRSVRLQACMDRPLTQVMFMLSVLLYGFLYAATVSWSNTKNLEISKDLYVLTKPMGYLLIGLLMFELVLRCVAQEGERFFAPVWHKIEIFVLMLGLLSLGYGSWYSNAFRNEGLQAPQALITASLLILHRTLRCIGLRFEVKADQYHADNVWSGAVAEWLRINCGDALDIPTKNIRVSYDHGIKLVICKAMVKPEVLADLHLPITVTGVYLEELEVRIPQLTTLLGKIFEGAVHKAKVSSDGSGELKNGSARSVLRLRGAVILLEPGNGLKEAGTGAGVVRQSSAPSCDDEENFVVLPSDTSELTRASRASRGSWGFGFPSSPGSMVGMTTVATRLTGRLRASSSSSRRSRRSVKPARGSPDARSAQNDARLASTFFGSLGQNMQASPSADEEPAPYWTFERLLEARSNFVDLVVGQFPWALQDTIDELRPMVDRCLASWELDIRPARVQYSDPDGVLGEGLTTVCLNVGTFWARWQQGHAAAADITRVSLRVEPGTSSAGVDDLSSGDSMNAEVRLLSACEASRLDPRRLTARLRQENALERFRVWSLEALARQRPLSAEQRHFREERWQASGRGTVLSLLWVRILGGKGPKAPGPVVGDERSAKDPGDTDKDLDAFVGETKSEVDDRAQEHAKLFETSRTNGRPQSGVGGPGGGLSWRVQTHPIRINVDSDQVRSLRTIALCTRAWILRDYAFRWRPGVLPSEAMQLPAKERRTVARLWWLYAVHRVLADLSWTSPRSPWLESAWLAANRHQFATLLANLNRRKKPLAWEQRWLKELQVQLPLEDVIRCRAQAFLDNERREFVPAVAPEDVRVALSGGRWTVFVPVIDVRILRPAQPSRSPVEPVPRPVLCHMRLEGLAVDVEEPSDPGADDRRLTLSLGDIFATCPMGTELTLGVPRRILWVERPLVQRGASYPLMEGCRASCPRLSLELRACLMPNMHAIVELRVASLRAVIMEPLVVELARIFGPLACADVGSAKAQGRSMVQSVAATEAAYRRGGDRVSKLARQFKMAPTEALNVANGRPIGPFAESFQLFDTEAALDIANASSELWLRAGVLREARAVVEELKLEAMAFGALAASAASGGLREWSADVSVGHLAITQVGEYSRSSLLVEDYELGPLYIRGGKEQESESFTIQSKEQESESVTIHSVAEDSDLSPNRVRLQTLWSSEAVEVPSPFQSKEGQPTPGGGIVSTSGITLRGLPKAVSVGGVPIDDRDSPRADRAFDGENSLLGFGLLCSMGAFSKPCGDSLRPFAENDVEEASTCRDCRAPVVINPQCRDIVTGKTGTSAWGAEASTLSARRRHDGSWSLTVRTVPRRGAFGSIPCG